MGPDRKIRADVEAELDFDPRIDATGIGVAVKDGIVSLTGHVPDLPQVMAAERAAQRVRGVKAVTHDLRVRLPGLFQHADDAIALRAANMLKWSVGSTPGIKIAVHAGWVSLSGTVAWGYERQKAEHAIRQLGGVVGITNAITVKPTVKPFKVKEAIAAALRRNADIDSTRIDVSVDGSEVILTGSVKGWNERKLVEDAAWAIPGISEVRDRITLG